MKGGQNKAAKDLNDSILSGKGETKPLKNPATKMYQVNQMLGLVKPKKYKGEL